MSGERRRAFVRRSLGDARALPGTSILTSAADFKPGHRSSMPSDEPTNRDVPSSRFTRHRPSGATLQRRFRGSASNAPREQPTGNLDGRRVKCSTMMAAALHGQNENYPPLHTYQNPHAPLFLRSNPLQLRAPPGPAARATKNASPAQRGPRRE